MNEVTPLHEVARLLVVVAETGKLKAVFASSIRYKILIRIGASILSRYLHGGVVGSLVWVE